MNIVQAGLKAKPHGLEISRLPGSILMKVERKEEKQVERKNEDENAQVWTGITCI